MPKCTVNLTNSGVNKRRRERWYNIEVKPVPVRSPEWKSYNSECPICLEAGTEKTPLNTRLSFFGKKTCNHTFHRNCLYRHCRSKGVKMCPCCRESGGVAGQIEFKNGTTVPLSVKVHNKLPHALVVPAFFELAKLKIKQVVFIKRKTKPLVQYDLDFQPCECEEEDCDCQITSAFEFSEWYRNIPADKKKDGTMSMRNIANYGLIPILEKRAPHVLLHVLRINKERRTFQCFTYPEMVVLTK